MLTFSRLGVTRTVLSTSFEPRFKVPHRESPPEASLRGISPNSTRNGDGLFSRWFQCPVKDFQKEEKKSWDVCSRWRCSRWSRGKDLLVGKRHQFSKFSTVKRKVELSECSCSYLFPFPGIQVGHSRLRATSLFLNKEQP